MTLESSSNLFSLASLVCSLSFWLGAILSYFPGAPGINLSGAHWLAILGIGAILAVAAAVLNFQKKLWIFALLLAIATFFFVMYVIST
jgi:hypothetical protein